MTEKPHLRLVVNRDKPANYLPNKIAEASDAPDLGFPAKQFRLPFEQEDRIAFLAMEQLHGSRFRSVLVSFRPRVVADLRHFARFDLNGLRPDEGLGLISVQGALYLRVQATLQLGTLERDALQGFAAQIIASLAQTAPNLSGPLLVLMQRFEHISLLAPYIMRTPVPGHSAPWTEQVLPGQPSAFAKDDVELFEA